MAGTMHSRFTVENNFKLILASADLFRMLGGTTNSEIDQNWVKI
jgi:hypothetical protein